MSTQKKWTLLKGNSELQKQIADKFKLSPVVAGLLINRGITDDNNIKSFIESTDVNQFLDPFVLPGMDCAVKKIHESVNAGEKIAVYGDYDVDGITSTYILYDYLSSLGADVIFYIPDRAEEGYGINIPAIDKLAAKNVKLIITVDVGITAVNEVEYAKSKSVDFIITDHHTPKETLPGAIAVINPKTHNNPYQNKNLAGVGVAFKLVYALSGCRKEIMDKYAEAAAIGTIADMVPLIGENRFIASYGIKCLSKTQSPGLNALMEIAGIDKAGINSTSVSFAIAPRLNAAGRIASAVSSVLLFLEKNTEEAEKIALYLDEGNKTRQREEQNIINEAIEIIERDKLYNDNVIVVAQKNWHHGVIGIVSSKITDRYYKPSAVISINSDGSAKASGRSIDGFNLFDALSACSDCLTKFGGHDLAAGFSLEAHNIDAFRKKINEYSKPIITEEMLIRKLTIDSELSGNDLTLGLARELDILEPYGIGNRQPLFAITDANVKDIKIHKSGKHAFIYFEKDGSFFDAPAFNMADTFTGYESGSQICLAGTVNINNFRGNDNVQFQIKDSHCGKNGALSVENLRVLYVIVRNLINNGHDRLSAADLSRFVKTNSPLMISAENIITALKIFDELRLFECDFQTEYITLKKGSSFDSKIDLNKSEIYCRTSGILNM